MSGWDADGALVSVRPVMRMCWLASIHNTAMKVMGKEEYEPIQSLYEQAAMQRKSSQTPKHLLFLCHLEDDSLCQSATLCFCTMNRTWSNCPAFCGTLMLLWCSSCEATDCSTIPKTNFTLGDHTFYSTLYYWFLLDDFDPCCGLFWYGLKGQLMFFCLQRSFSLLPRVLNCWIQLYCIHTVKNLVSYTLAFLV